MFKADYQFRPEPVHHGWVRDFRQWLKDSRAGRNWLLAVLSVQAVSAWTNVHGLALALPLPAAILLGVGLQVLALYAGVAMLNASEEDKGRWRRPLTGILCVSIFCSFMGLSSFYGDYVDHQTMPLKARDDLKSQALILSSKANEARTLAKAKLENRIAYSRDLISRIRSNQARGEYPDPSAAEAMVAEQNSRIQASQEEQAQWDAFKFDAQAAVAQPEVSQGFSMLQSAYGDLSRLMGTMTKDESKGFKMPDPPLPTINEADQAPKKSQIEHAFGQMLSLSGFFFLFLAGLMEAIPFWLAHAKKNDANAEIVEDGPVPLHPHGVPALGRADSALATEISNFNALVRPVHFIGSANMAEVEEQGQRVQGVVNDLRKAYVEALRHHSLQKMADVRRQHLELIVREAKAYGVPDRELQTIVQEQWLEFLKDAGVEDVRLEQLREERRTQVFRPSEEPSW